MMNFYKYEKLYELFISNNIVTTAILLENGYSKYDIGTLVKNNVLNIEGVGIEIKELSKSEIVAKGKINRIYLSREFLNEEKKQTDK